MTEEFVKRAKSESERKTGRQKKKKKRRADTEKEKGVGNKMRGAECDEHNMRQRETRAT